MVINILCMNADDVIQELGMYADSERALVSQRFFKTGIGEYGEGDVFIGVTVPRSRTIAKKYQNLDYKEIKKLLLSGVHEHRFVALEILVFKYESGKEKERVVLFYLTNKKRINNWDLVDTSAPYILGDWLLDNDPAILFELVRSRNVWERRIAIVATYAFIRKMRYEETCALAEILLTDTHDLIHKAVGWMLREVGKRSLATEESFIKKYASVMPRTMLRYAIERFPEEKRTRYLSAKAQCK